MHSSLYLIPGNKTHDLFWIANTVIMIMQVTGSLYHYSVPVAELIMMEHDQVNVTKNTIKATKINKLCAQKTRGVRKYRYT